MIILMWGFNLVKPQGSASADVQCVSELAALSPFSENIYTFIPLPESPNIIF